MHSDWCFFVPCINILTYLFTIYKIFPDHQQNSLTFQVSGNPVKTNITVQSQFAWRVIVIITRYSRVKLCMFTETVVIPLTQLYCIQSILLCRFNSLLQVCIKQVTPETHTNSWDSLPHSGVEHGLFNHDRQVAPILAPHLTHFLGRAHTSLPQMASRSVQPFLQVSTVTSIQTDHATSRHL